MRRGGYRHSVTAIEPAERLARLALESSPVTHQPLGSHYLLHERIGQGGMGVVWRALDVSTDSWYAIKNSASTWCLGVTESSTAAGALIAQGHCAEDTSQQWHVTATVTTGGYAYRQYQNGHSGLCLDVSGSSATSGAHLVQSTCSDTSDHAQFWRNENTAAGSGDYHFVNYHSGMCMGIQGPR